MSREYAFNAGGEDWWVAVDRHYSTNEWVGEVCAADYCDGSAYLSPAEMLAFAKALTEAAAVLTELQAKQ